MNIKTFGHVTFQKFREKIMIIRLTFLGTFGAKIQPNYTINTLDSKQVGFST